MNPDFDLLYINLDRATGRREAIENSIRDASFSPAWQVTRFPAIQGDSDQVAKTPGRMSPSMKGNWLSHVGCMRHALANDWKSHLIICEDDAHFSAMTQPLVMESVSSLPPDSWDVIFLDFIVSRAIDMPYFFSMKQNCLKKGSLYLHDMQYLYARYAIAGSSSYIINKSSVHKLFTELDSIEIPVSYDIMIRHLITSGKIKSCVIFPFPVTVGIHADNTTVDHSDDWAYQCHLMNEFRRLVWAGTEMEPPSTKRQNGEVTSDVQKLQSIFGRLLSLQYGLV